MRKAGSAGRVFARLAVLLVLAVLTGEASSCHGNQSGPTSLITWNTPTEEAATLTPVPSAFASPTANERAAPITMAGIKLYPHQVWFEQGRSRCASRSMEAPYRGPTVHSISKEDLPELALPAGELYGVRVCKDDITVIGYIYEHAFVMLVDGPREWPVSVPADRISAGTVAGRPAVLVAPSEPGQPGGATVIAAEEYGLSVVTRTAGLEDAKRIAAEIDREGIAIPPAKESFSGPLNGIRFYDGKHGYSREGGCDWGVYGAQTHPVAIPAASPLDVLPSYLPQGYALESKSGGACGGDIDLVEARFSHAPELGDLMILRLAGEPAWYSPVSDDWLTPGTVDGRPAVFIAPPEWAAPETDVRIHVVVREAFGLTVVWGRIPLDEAIRIAEGLNR